jgi:hypothetical protein
MAPQLYNFSDDPLKQLKDRIFRRLKEDMISDKMLNVVKNAFAESIRSENILLSRAEYNRLFRTVLQEMIDDMLAGLSNEN